MPTAAIAGCSGYSGQETLDRVLSHPELELIALGSDSLAGDSASALDVRLNGDLPDFVSNDEALASGADVVFLCLGHEEAAALEPPAEGVVVDLSGAHRLHDRTLYADWYGFEHPHPEGLARWSYALPELLAPTGRLIANPGCYATAALLALLPLANALDPDSVVVDAKSGVSGAGRALRPSSHAGPCSKTSPPTAWAPTSTPPRSPRRSGSPCASSRTCCRSGAGCSPRATRGSTQDGVRERLESAYATTSAVRVLPVGVSRSWDACRALTWRRSPASRTGATGRAVVVCALDNLGKGAAGQAVQNANLALGLDETLGLRLTGPRMSVTAASRVRASGVHCGIRKASPDLALVAPLTRATGAAMFTVNRVQAAPVKVSREHLELAEPQAVVVNSGVANAATGVRGELDAMATAAEAARLLDLDAEEILVLSTGVIGEQLPLGKLLPGLARAAEPSPRRQGRRPRGRS